MTKLLIVAIILGMVLLSSCSNSIYWENKKKTSTGKHSYYQPGWGYRSTCNTYKSLPTKQSSYKRYHYWRLAKQ